MKTMRTRHTLSDSIKLIKPPSLFIKNVSTLPPDSTNIVENLVSIFLKQPFSPEDPELKSIAPKLNPKLVETALNGFKSWREARNFFNWASSQNGFRHNVYTYNAMASILSGARQNAQLKSLFLEILDSRFPMSPGALGFLIRCFGGVGLVEEANMLFDHVTRAGLCVPNNYSYNCLLEALASSDSVDLVEMRLTEMRDNGWEFDKYTLTPVLQVYCNARRYDKALDVFDEAYNRSLLDGHMCSILVLSLSKRGEVDKAVELIEIMEDRNIRLNEKTFHVLIHGFVKQSRVDKALQLFDMIKQSGYPPNILLYDALIRGLIADKEPEKALRLYLEMLKSGIHPDDRIITSLMISLSGVKKLTHLFEKIYSDSDGEALTLLFNFVLHYFTANGSVDRAHHLIRAMLGSSRDDAIEIEVVDVFRDKGINLLDTASFSIVINGLLKAEKLDLALGLFEDMARLGCKRDLLLYNNLIDGLCKSDRLEESYDLLEEMEASGFEPTHFTHNSIYGCLCRRVDVSQALDLVKKMRIHGHQPYTKHTTLLMKELCKLGNALEACKFLADLVKEGFPPYIISYSAVLDGLVNIHEVDQALNLFRDICRQGYRPDVIAYNTLIKGLCKAQRISEAQDLFSEMVTEGLVPSVVTYNLLINGWCKDDHIEKAMCCLSRMFEAGREPNVVTYTTLIDGLCKAGRPEDAIKLWKEMGSEGCTPNSVAYMAFIHGLCSCTRPDEALYYLREMERKDLEADTFVYAALLGAFVASLNLPLAFEILKDMGRKGKVPEVTDKNFEIIRDAVHKFSKDATTSSGVEDLLASGSIPAIMLSDISSQGAG